MIDMSTATYVVLGGGRSPLTAGLAAQTRKILQHVPADRQTPAATWPKAVIRVATAILTNPIQVNIARDRSTRG